MVIVINIEKCFLSKIVIVCSNVSTVGSCFLILKRFTLICSKVCGCDRLYHLVLQSVSYFLHYFDVND